MVTNLSMGVIEADIRAARRALESYNISNNKYDKSIVWFKQLCSIGFR